MRFAVKGVSTITGKNLRIVIPADSVEDARTQARAQGVFPYRITAVRGISLPAWMTREGRQRMREDRERRSGNDEQPAASRSQLAREAQIAGFVRLAVSILAVGALAVLLYVSAKSMFASPSPPQMTIVEPIERTENDIRRIEGYTSREESVAALEAMSEAGVEVDEMAMVEGYFYLAGNGAFMRYEEFLKRYTAQRIDEKRSHLDAIRELYRKYSRG